MEKRPRCHLEEKKLLIGPFKEKQKRTYELSATHFRQSLERHVSSALQERISGKYYSLGS